MIDRAQYEKAVRRYNGFRDWVGLAAFSLMNLVMGLELAVLMLNKDSFTRWLKPLASVLGQEVFGGLGIVVFMTPAITVAILFCVCISRRLKRDRCLSCPACTGFLGCRVSLKHILSVGTCPRCDSRLIPIADLPDEASLNPSPTPSPILMSRRRWDVYFGLSVLAGFSLCMIHWMANGEWRYFTVLVVMIGFWLFGRNKLTVANAPREGGEVTRSTE